MVCPSWPEAPVTTIISLSDKLRNATACMQQRGVQFSSRASASHNAIAPRCFGCVEGSVCAANGDAWLFVSGKLADACRERDGR